ncbi:MAG TPA: hypothetical protein DCM87_03170 [Planctomycetes bacterium]|nr:hypothetical protein [Planctomycetota bacterium]
MNGALGLSPAPRVGFVMFAGLFVLTVGLYLVALRPTVVGDLVPFISYFAETGGLRKGAPVWIGGVEVGTVQNVGFADAEMRAALKKEIVVTLAIGRQFRDRIREDAVCRVKTRGLLGEKYVTIKAGTALSDEVPIGGVIRSEEASDITDVMTTAGETVETTAVEAALLLKELRRIVTEVEKKEGTLGKILLSDEFYRDMFARIDRIVEELSQELTALNSTLKNEIGAFRTGLGDSLARVEHEVVMTTEDVRETSARLRSELAEVGALAREVREGRGAAGMLVRDDAFARDLGEAVRSLGDTAERIASVFKKIDDGEGTMGLLVNDPEAYMSLRDLFEGIQASWLLHRAVREAEATGRELRIERRREAEKGE